MADLIQDLPEAPFQKSKAIQEEYARALRGVSRQVGNLIKGYNPTDPLSAERLRKALRAYSELIGPWAETISKRILVAVNNQDYNAWRQHSREMSLKMRQEILSSNVGETFQRLMRENVELIKSIPLKAAERVHELVTENLMQSARADEISQKIMESEKVSKVVATRIARTEIARASSTLLQSRALSIGSTGYIWKTSKDLLVRKSHKIMEGKFIKWNDPPKLSDGTITHAGQIYNCRCWPDVQIPEGNYS